MPDDPVALLRIAALLGFLAAFVALVAWMLRPASRRTLDDAARIPFREDPPREEPR